VPTSTIPRYFFYGPDALPAAQPNQQRQSTEGNKKDVKVEKSC